MPVASTKSLIFDEVFVLSADAGFASEKEAAGTAVHEITGEVQFELIRNRRLGEMNRARLSGFDDDVIEAVDYTVLVDSG